MTEARPTTYLVVGHVTKDVIPDGYTTGGTASFAGRTAQVLGCQTAVLTSVDPAYELADLLPQLTIYRLPAPHSTTFENIYTPNGRMQVLHAVAAPLRAVDVPAAYRQVPVVHLGPVANEVDPNMVHLFPGSLVGLTPQGWMRQWDGEGYVRPQVWEMAATIMPWATAVVVSEEDLPNQATLHQFRQWSRILVLTQGSRGCTVFYHGEVRQFPACRVSEVEFTGAGDIFAAAFFIRLWQTDGNPWAAADFANQIAAQSVTQPDLPHKMTQIGQYYSEMLGK